MFLKVRRLSFSMVSSQFLKQRIMGYKLRADKQCRVGQGSG